MKKEKEEVVMAVLAFIVMTSVVVNAQGPSPVGQNPE
jgi:hypothetical protein